MPDFMLYACKIDRKLYAFRIQLSAFYYFNISVT